MELRVIELLLSLLGLVLMAGVSFYSLREIKRSKALITNSIPSLEDFIQRTEGGETIIREDLAMLIDAFGSRIAKSLKMSFLQSLGAQSKITSGLKGAMMEGVVQNQMPIIGLLGEIFGIPVEKYLRKHPEAIMQLAPMAKSFMGGKGGFDLNSIMGQGQPSQNNGSGGM